MGALGMPDSKMNFVLQELQKLAIYGPEDSEEKKSKAQSHQQSLDEHEVTQDIVRQPEEESKEEVGREFAENQSIQSLEQSFLDIAQWRKESQC